ncbi:MAG: Nre family DNA repair protein [Candidatus Bathyarchaeota archaeon]|nr:Nre family DNA repair protein [Candidatus Bathyarchaeota archaeon]
MRRVTGGKRNAKLIRLPKKPKPATSDNSWVKQLLDKSSLAADIDYNKEQLVATAKTNTLCAICKGGKFLCGKTRCPLVVRFSSYFESSPLMQGTDLDGACPPGVFVGRIGYPYVYAGPLVPPVHEDTSQFDLPESWFGKSIDEIVGFRSMLVRGKHRVHVTKFEESGKIMDQTIDLALSTNPVDVEMALKKKPTANLVLDSQIQPFGPSAPLKNMNVSNPKWDQQIQKAYFDDDLHASEAVTTLFDKGTLVSNIQRAFSVGAFGIKKQRRLVPTRWSITAVDSIISKEMMEQIKTFPEINEYRIYESNYLDNRFEILMIPREWSYEAMEAWYPGTIWNPSGDNVMLFGDYEGYNGRTTYASIGGCYYSARLAVGELLTKERKQASVTVLREAHPGYIMPVGVWQVRENVRNALRQKPYKYNTLKEALTHIGTKFEIPIKQWIEKSTLLRNTLFQKRITDYLAKNATM